MRAPVRPLGLRFPVGARSARGTSRTASGSRLAHALTAFFLLMGLFAPLSLAMPTAAAPQPGAGADRSAAARKPGTPPPLPAPFSVVAAGDFQAALGCPGDFDASCGATALQDNGDGTWSGFFPIPAGSYALRIIATSDIDRSLGEDGDPEGDDITFNVSDNEIIVYIAYNALTGEITVAPAEHDVVLQTDLGAFQMVPTEDGDFEVYFDVGGGSFNVQAIVDGAPAEPTTINADQSGRAHIVVDQNGDVQDAEIVQPASLTAQKTDEAGNPLPGACFAAYDGRDVLSQTCDASDGSEDGTTILPFPRGVQGSIELAETSTPEGQEEAENQDVELDPGDNFVQVVVAGGEAPPDEEPTEEPPIEEPPVEEDPTEEPPVEEPPIEEPPIEEPGDETVQVAFQSVDENGALIAGVCYQLDDGQEECDEDGDGVVVFDNVTPGQHTVTETFTPEGFQGIGTEDFTVDEDGVNLQVPHTTVAVEPETGALVVQIVDEEGFGIVGACVSINGPQSLAQCDNENGDDDASDGVIQVENLAAGDYQVSLDSAPEGFETAGVEGESTTVDPGGQGQVTLTVPAAAPPTSDLLIGKRDQNGDRIGGACFTMSGPAEYGPICDNDENDGHEDEGWIRFNGVQVGDYIVSEVQAPPGFTGAEDQQVTIVEGDTARLSFDNIAETGTLVAFTNDTDGNPIGGACFEVTNFGEICDQNANGDMTLTDAPAGDYTVTQTSVPEGYELAAEPVQQITVVAGETAQVFFVSEESGPEIGSLRIDIQDEDGAALVGSCIAINGPQDLTQCDNDNGDENPDDGVIEVENLEPGDYQVALESVPDGFEAAESQSTTVTAGEQAQATLIAPTAPPPTGNLVISKVNGDGDPLGGACFVLSGPAEYGPVCDNGEGDADDDEGEIQINDVQVGQYELTEETTPEGFTAAGPQPVEVEEGETARVTVENAPATGVLVAFTNDADGNPIGGVCYELTNFGEICDQNDNGDMMLPDAPVGDYTITQTSVPDGYELDDEPTREVTVEVGETTEVNYTSALQAGAIRIAKTDGENPLGGACFSVDGGEQVCDNGDGDTDDAEGVIEIQNVAPGDHTVSETEAPGGYQGADDQTVTVPAGDVVDVTFVNTLEAGSLQIAVTDEATGEPLGGACVLVQGPETVEVCDNGDGDADENDGSIVVEDLPPGDYAVSFSETPEGFQDPGSLQMAVGPGEESGLPIVLPPLPTEEPEPTDIPTEEPTATSEPTEEPTATEEATEEPTAVPRGDPTEEPAPTEEPTEEAEPTEEPTETPLGQVGIAKTDGENPLAGACFALSGPSDVGPVCDNEAGDNDPDEGTILLTDVPVGAYAVTETEAPDGFTAGPDAAVTVTEGETAQIEVVNTATPAEVGILRILSQGPEGTTAGGGCYEVGATTVCDNGDNDSDPTPGEIDLEGVTVGSYEVTESTPPPGFLQADPQAAEVLAGKVAEVIFTHEPEPPATGGIQMELQDPEGNSVDGACVTLQSGELDEALEVCDGGDEDTDPDPGSLVVDDLPVGVYSLGQADPPAEEQVEAAFAPAGFDEKTVTVQANQIIIVIIIIIIQIPDEGDLIVIKEHADTNQLLPGACFQVTGQGDDVEICDNDANDGHGSAGILRFDDLQTGEHTLSETEPPVGFEAAADQQVDIEPGVTVVEVDDEPEPVTNGDLTVVKVNEDGDLLENSCFVLRDGNVVAAGPLCDDDDDGRITFTDIPGGTYTLRETQAPSNAYFLAPDQQVEVIAGQTDTEVEVVNNLKPGRVQVRKEDEDDNLLGGACFALDGPGDFEVCDNQAGDHSAQVGIIRFEGIPAGDYTLIETLAPTDFETADDEPITVQPNQTTFITIVNVEEPPPAQTGNLTVEKVDGNGDPLAGACFTLKQGQVTKVPQRCDATDGANDGTTTFTNVGVGDYQIHETVKPSNSYQTPAPTNVTIAANQTETVTVVNVLKTGRVLIRKVNQQGHPLQNACFDLSPDGKGPQCTNASGEAIFDNLDTTIVYKTRELEAPPGYLPAPDRTNIVVKPGLTTTITIVNKKAPPPPDSGSIRVIKFYCPAGDAGDRTQIIDSSDPGPSKLTKTAGCTRGNARFTLDPQAAGATITFTTGVDGEYQATLARGTYTLTETDPVLAGGDRTENLIIGVNQQTTIVVINYLTPPAPAPGTVNVIKYTCAPGFEGVYYADFAANCADTGSLTNGVTFRLSGPEAGKRVTGDGGQKGQTRFTQLDSGTYTLREEPPTTAVTVYGFCGLDADNPSVKTLGETIAFDLNAGQTITCTWFNVPDEVSDSTGAIIVQKYVCDAASYPASFDWYEECSFQTDGVKFTLSLKSGEQYVPKSTGVTDPNGLLRFSQLNPGTYRLQEVGGDWCHAEADSVDTRGDVIVRAGQRSSVWIFNCVETKSPPNTGAGTTAGMPRPSAIGPAAGSSSGNMALLLSLVWPALGLAGYGWRRRRAA